MLNKLKFIAWNIHGKNSLTNDSYEHLKQYDIISLSETWSNSDSDMHHISGYDSYFVHSNRR